MNVVAYKSVGLEVHPSQGRAILCSLQRFNERLHHLLHTALEQWLCVGGLLTEALVVHDTKGIYPDR